jgi:hypothetical protein
MSTRIICDCGCGRELTGPDAGTDPVVVRSMEGIEVEIRVRSKDGEQPNMRACCVRELVRVGEVVEAPVECEACGEKKPGVAALSNVYSAWGRNTSHFAWRKTEGLAFCEKCEADEYRFCDDCGAAIEQEHYGIGYLSPDEEDDPEGYDGREICPGCAPKHGLVLTVDIADPPVYATPTPETTDEH